MTRILYSLLLRLALPFAVVAFLWRGWRTPAYRGSLAERLGFAAPVRGERPLWLHAASVGEVRALAALLRALTGERPPLLVTVGTPTGLARARELFADLLAPAGGGMPVLRLQAAPWDLPGATRRFIARAGPRAGVFIETELWPNLVRAAARGGVPLVLASGRLSTRSLQRYRRLAPALMRETVGGFAAIGVQSAEDGARFLALGADPQTVGVTGNLKYDLVVDPAIFDRGAALRARLAPDRGLWVAGSTHEGEEQCCLEAHGVLRQQALAGGRKPPLLALVPRRPERFDAVAKWLAAQQQRWVRASSARDAAHEEADVVLVDQMGVLTDWYAAGDVAFVGGSLVPVGGHNLLEPAALGRPVVAGPHAFNAPEVAQHLAAAGALVVVGDPAQLAAEVGGLLEQPQRALQRGERAAAAVAASRGSAARTWRLIEAVLTESAPAAAPASG